jgi:UDP-N-acetylmuramoylalanine-D-glutamate ligase
MMQLLKDRGVASHLVVYHNMEEAFDYLKGHSQPGDICLLSPAASSYDQYKNFGNAEESLSGWRRDFDFIRSLFPANLDAGFLFA